jgi:uncharacterized membrane protein YgaE (UPF0421/DUF939 family)
MKLGARIIKTGVAAAMALYACRWLGLGTGAGASFAAIAAVLMVQPSLYRSWRTFRDQLQANLIGASLAIVGVLLLGNQPVVVGLLVVLAILLNLRFKFDKSIVLAIVAVIAVSEGANSGEYLPFAFHRVLMILIGMTSAMLVNVVFVPPKYEEKLLSQIKETRDRMSLILRNMVYQEIQVYPTEKKKVQEELEKTEEFFDRYQEEQSYAPGRKKYGSARKLLLFKKMIRLMYREMDTIRVIERHHTAFAQMPDNVRERMQNHISDLTAYHQQVLGKFEGTIKTNYPHEKSVKIFGGHERLIRELIALYDPKTEQGFWIHLLPVVASLSELAIELDHLDKLIDVYATYHRKDKGEK